MPLRWMRRMVVVAALGLHPTVARADALDGAWIVAAAVGGVWLVTLLGVLTMGFGSATAGSRAMTALGIVGTWIVLSPPALIVLIGAWQRGGEGLYWGHVVQWVLAPGIVAGILTGLMLRALRRARQVRAHAPPESA